MAKGECQNSGLRKIISGKIGVKNNHDEELKYGVVMEEAIKTRHKKQN